MDEYTNPRGGFLYGRSSGPSNHHHQFPMSSFHHLESDGQNHAVVKTESGTSVNRVHRLQYPNIIRTHHHEGNDDIKSRIISHPQYSNLLQAYMDCQKVGAPPEVVERLTAVRRDFEDRQQAAAASRDDSKDPELDQFMEAYYDMLVKYREELSRPLEEAMEFMRRIESQLNDVLHTNSEEKSEGVGSSEEDQETGVDPRAEDQELKNHLLKKYSGYLGSLKQELSKKKKKGKLPKEARQKLLSWWDLHYKWPYPSESEKVALAEMTGLDQKQINNWFINQRKRHWKPSEDMQFMVMDSFHPQNAPPLYLEPHYMPQPPNYRLPP